MRNHYIWIAIYLGLGLFTYGTVGGMACRRDVEELPLWRKALAVVLWPLAMIGAIDG